MEVCVWLYVVFDRISVYHSVLRNLYLMFSFDYVNDGFSTISCS